MNEYAQGDGLRAVPFKYINCVDFEFRGDRGNPPEVVCMVVKELRSGHTRRYWKTELDTMGRAPFETGRDAVLIAYAAQAEVSCFFSLGWIPPANVIDQYAEFRAATNGVTRKASLLDALALHNLPHMDVALKDDMRDLVLRGGGWNEQEREQILGYCLADVEASAALFEATVASIDMPRAPIRGQYVVAAAKIEHNGIPMDLPLLRRVRRKWPRIRRELIAEVDEAFGVYDGETFKRDRFSRWLHFAGIPWPRRESGLLDLSDEAFKLQEHNHPGIALLRELRNTVRQADLDGLQVGYDGRARTSLRPFSSVKDHATNDPCLLCYPFRGPNFSYPRDLPPSPPAW